jgi:peptide chain release factor subunit 1
LKSVQYQLSRLRAVPASGLCVFCGLVWDDTQGERKIYLEMEPLAPLGPAEYICDNRFHTEALRATCAPRERFGFIVVGGRRSVLAVVCGQRTEILETVTADLPSKHRMGGQSAARFQRIADETRHNLCRQISESAKRRFLTGPVPNVTGLVLAGCAQLKNQLDSSDLLCDPLRRIVKGVVDIAYDGEHGLMEAVKKSRQIVANVTLVRDQRVLESLFDYAGQGRPMAFGVPETMSAWSAGAIAAVYVWVGLDSYRFERSDGSAVYGNRDRVVENVTGREKLVDWILAHHTDIGCDLELVGSDSMECAQFVKGLGGLAARLRFALDLKSVVLEVPAEDSDFDTDFDF